MYSTRTPVLSCGPSPNRQALGPIWGLALDILDKYLVKVFYPYFVANHAETSTKVQH